MQLVRRERMCDETGTAMTKPPTFCTEDYDTHLLMSLLWLFTFPFGLPEKMLLVEGFRKHRRFKQKSLHCCNAEEQCQCLENKVSTLPSSHVTSRQCILKRYRDLKGLWRSVTHPVLSYKFRIHFCSLKSNCSLSSASWFTISWVLVICL